MSSLVNWFHGPELEEVQKKNAPKIIEIASQIIDTAYQKFSLPQYTGEKQLDFMWTAVNAFQASASVRGNNHHSISISYGVPLALYKDATILPLLYKDEVLIGKELRDKAPFLFVEDDIDEFFSIDKNWEWAKSIYFASSLSWAYFHEQAHLFQNHGVIYRGKEFESHDIYQWIEVNESNQKTLTGKAAWVRHCFELSADYEAIDLTLICMIERCGGWIEKPLIWLFMFALNCIFFRFHENNPRIQSREAIGSHPPPSFRMYYAHSRVLNFLDHPKILDHIDWARDREELRRVLGHACISARIYAWLTCGSDGKISMDEALGDDETLEKYVYGIQEVWASLFPQVKQSYFGLGGVMPVWR